MKTSGPSPKLAALSLVLLTSTVPIIPTVAKAGGCGTSWTSGDSSNSGSIDCLTASSPGTFTNTGTIGSNIIPQAVQIQGSAGTLINNGTITSSGRGISMTSGVSLGTLINTDTIHSETFYAIANDGHIGTITNSGIISNNGIGAIATDGTIDVLNNSGLITSTQYAIYNLYSGPSLPGNFGPINNSGTIAGQIYNSSTYSLVINGGSDSTFGKLTGTSGGVTAADISTITSTNSDFIFGSGNTLLNDNINAGSHNVTNTAATLQVNNPLAITGNYNQGSAATLKIGVADAATALGAISDTGYGRLTVSGNATFDAGSKINLSSLNNYVFAQGQRFLIVDAAAGSNYNSDLLNYTATGYNGTVLGETVTNGTKKDLVLTLSAPPTPVATTPNAIASIGGLYNAPATNATLQPLYNAVVATSTQGTEAANRAGAQLSAAPNTAASAQVTLTSSITVLNVINSHSDSMRLAKTNGESGIATGETSLHSAVWAETFGGQTRQSERDYVAGYSASYGGILIGADTQFSTPWHVGGIFSYTNTSASDTGDNTGSSIGINSYGLMGYGSYTGKQWYLNLIGGGFQNQYSTTRNIEITNFTGVANGEHNGMQYLLSGQVGRPFDIGSFLPEAKLTPIAGLTYNYLTQDGYTETGSAAALSVSSSNLTSVKSELGAKLERSFATGYGELVPSVQLSWRHEFQDTRLQNTANFAADPSGATGFVTTGASPFADTGVLSLGLTLLHNDRLALSANYAVEAASDYTAQSAFLRARWSF